MKTPKLNKSQLAAAGIFSAVSGALALYLTKKPELRKKLTKSGSPADAVKLFGEHVQKDSTQFVKSLKDFATRSMPTGRALKREMQTIEKNARKVKAGAKRGAAALQKTVKYMN